MTSPPKQLPQSSFEVPQPAAIEKSSLPYRPDIDGLRAIAVGSVLVHHVYPHVLPGGFVGVDIFFVISGFLISRIIWCDLNSGRFTLRNFYARRIRRIFPSLLLVLVCAWGVGWSLVFWDDFARLGKHIFAGAFFISNFALWSEGGYFDIAAERKPLLHLWSLSIEEQFYLLWPLALWTAAKKRLPFPLIGLPLGAASFGYCAWLSYVDETAAFYTPLTRMWELCLGALAGWLVLTRDMSESQKSQAFSAVGVIMITGSVLFFSSTLTFPGWIALLPALGTATLLWSSHPSSIIHSRLLATRPLVGLGLISYPAYLWHWPLHSFLGLLAPAKVLTLATHLVIPMSILLAWLTYRFVETPIRIRHATSKAVKVLVVSMLAIGSIGAVTYLCRGFASFSQAAKTAPFLTRNRELGEWLKDVRVGACHLNMSEAFTHADECTERGELSIALFGDSLAAALYPGLAHLQKSYPFALSQFTAGKCPPLLDTRVATRPNCEQVNQAVLARLKDLQPSILILGGRWYREDMGLTPEQVLDRVRHSINVLQGLLPKTTIVLIGPIPEWPPDLPTVLAHYINERKSLPPAYLELPHNPITEGVKEMDESLAVLAAQEQVRYISLFTILCEGSRCLTRLGDSLIELVVFDDSHLNAPSSILVVVKIKDVLTK